MRHHNHNRKFGRVKRQRVSLLRSLAVSFIKNEKIRTTTAKAKELRSFVEKLVTKAKKDSLSSRRLLISDLGGDKFAAEKLTKEISGRYRERFGGYTRIIKFPVRQGDGSPMSVIEFV